MNDTDKLTMRNYYLKEYAYHHKPKSNGVNPLLNVLSCNASLNNDSRQQSTKKQDSSIDSKP